MSRIPLALCALLLTACHQQISKAPSKLEPVVLAQDGRGFICMPSRRPFHPWGNNYGCAERLIEDFWASDWPTVARDFQEMKSMGANVVRVHFQFGRFMLNQDKLNPDALRQLARLVQLSEQTGLYLDITGLACYRKADVPAWYDALSESSRWQAQARFWEGVAAHAPTAPPSSVTISLTNPASRADNGNRATGISARWAGITSANSSTSIRPAGSARRSPANGSKP